MEIKDLKFVANIENGKIKYSNKEMFDYLLKGLEGQKIYVVIKKFRKDRSNNQNSYLWGVVYKMIADYTGHTEDEIHEVLKSKFLKKIVEITDKNGMISTYQSSMTTTKLTTIEMEEYLEKCRNWSAQELGVIIPLPNEDVSIDES